MLIDSHCHLDFDEFNDDRAEVLGRARALGVQQFLTISTHVSRFAPILAIAEANNDIHCTIGVHPHHAHEEITSVTELCQIAAHPKVVGIGETGLDYYYDNAPRDAQIDSFTKHIEAACILDLPLIIHTREADTDTMQVIKTAAAGVGGGRQARGVLHCFTSGRALAEEALEYGFYISISGIVTFKSAKDLQETVQHIPLDRLLVETDAPYLAPIPHRGKRNEPAFVADTARFIADLKGISFEELASQTTKNFFTLFNKVCN